MSAAIPAAAVQSWEKSEELLLSTAQTSTVQTPIYMGHLKHNASKTDLIPHLSVDSTEEEWMKGRMNEGEAPLKTGVFLYSHEGPASLPPCVN